ncbi:MAG: dephospho-CoA kinase [Bacteroidetes bacterium]|nr:dephospho-CoA kinase [Bacteroidota bacterium]
MFKVGITGGIGSGKTLVCSILEELGIPVYYADREARRLMNSEPGLQRGVRDLLGGDAYLDGELNRQEVGNRVFEDPGLLEKLNRLVHPVVRTDFNRWCRWQEEAPYVVEEAAILFESGADRHLDMTVLVYAPLELRIGRVMERDGVGRSDVEKRMSRQMDEEEKKRLADRVIINDEMSLLLPRIVALHKEIIKRT